jgi:diaminohydroxyphosphoribosylaminopyrimidine deaminase/5-amino-6-(5-phosphoribosylamino)uracil reductase
VTTLDEQMMQAALDQGRLGDPSPNPHVGCVIAKGDQKIAEGFHREAGGPHAEVQALTAAGAAAKGATLYVTLSPCNHTGRTPPCVDAILKAGIQRVVIGCDDPNPKVEGGAVARLKAAGIEVVTGVVETEAKALIRPWSKFVTQGVSFLTLKFGVSLDGRIATKTGVSRWITGEESQHLSHVLRAQHDAICVGVNTVIQDDPQLTVRHVQGRNPVRVVFDSKLRIPLESRLVTTARETPTCVLTTDAAAAADEEALTDLGVSIVRVPANAQGRCDVLAGLKALAAREVVSVLCEGGAELAGSLLAGKLIDDVHLFVAPMLLGPRGRPWAVDWAGPELPEHAPRIKGAKWELCGSDIHVSGALTYPKKPKTGPVPQVQS